MADDLLRNHYRHEVRKIVDEEIEDIRRITSHCACCRSLTAGG